MMSMKKNKEYTILFKGLKAGNHLFKYEIKKKFFESFNYDEYIDTDIQVELVLIKSPTLLELSFTIKGIVQVNCDVSGEEFDQSITGDLEIIVKFGEKFNNDDEVVLILPHHEYELNISQFIYEVIIFSTPTKRVHPGIVDGTLKTVSLSKLEELNSNNKKKETDPRWDKLKELKKQIKNT